MGIKYEQQTRRGEALECFSEVLARSLIAFHDLPVPTPLYASAMQGFQIYKQGVTKERWEEEWGQNRCPLIESCASFVIAKFFVLATVFVSDRGTPMPWATGTRM